MFVENITIKEINELNSLGIHVKTKDNTTYFYCQPNESSYVVVYSTGTVEVYGRYDNLKLEQLHAITSLLMEHKYRAVNSV